MEIRTEMRERTQHIEQAARFLKGMAHPRRLKILWVPGAHGLSEQDSVDPVGTLQGDFSQRHFQG